MDAIGRAVASGDTSQEPALLKAMTCSSNSIIKKFIGRNDFLALHREDIEQEVNLSTIKYARKYNGRGRLLTFVQFCVRQELKHIKRAYMARGGQHVDDNDQNLPLTGPVFQEYTPFSSVLAATYTIGKHRPPSAYADDADDFRRQRISAALGALTRKERAVIGLFFGMNKDGLNLTLKQTAEYMGLKRGKDEAKETIIEAMRVLKEKLSRTFVHDPFRVGRGTRTSSPRPTSATGTSAEQRRVPSAASADASSRSPR